MDKPVQYFRKPEGVKDLLPKMAALKGWCEGVLNNVFSTWNYQEVVPPTVEYSSIFTAGMKSDFEEELYRFPDERGRTLVLRPDFTLPLARIVATHMAGEPLPLRLFYQGNIFRYISPKKGRQREFYQSGVELIGGNAPRADAEVIALAVASLAALGINEAKICLGSLNFLNRFLQHKGLKEEEKEAVKKIFSRKDFVALERYVNELSIGEKDRQEILTIPALKGGKEVLLEAAKMLPGESPCLEELAELFNLLECMGVAEKVMIDLGLVRGLDYYTGIIFEGYTSSLGSPICGGGRYDQLLGFFGPDLPAVGFALNIDNILLLLSRKGCEAFSDPRTLVAFSPEGTAHAYGLASRLRKEGEVVEVALASMVFEEAKKYAQARDIDKFVYFNGKEQIKLDLDGGSTKCQL